MYHGCGDSRLQDAEWTEKVGGGGGGQEGDSWQSKITRVRVGVPAQIGGPDNPPQAMVVWYQQ